MIQRTLREAAKKKYPRTADLAALLNVSPMQAWRFVNGHSGITGKRLDILAEDLGVQIVINDSGEGGNDERGTLQD